MEWGLREPCPRPLYNAPVPLLRWTRRVRLLAALLALVAGLAYPLRTLPDAPPMGAQAHHTGSCGGRTPGPGSSPGAAHDAHCLFCLTGAFSTAPDPALPIPHPAGRPAHGPSPAPRAAHAFVAHADARAPPRATA